MILFNCACFFDEFQKIYVISIVPHHILEWNQFKKFILNRKSMKIIALSAPIPVFRRKTLTSSFVININTTSDAYALCMLNKNKTIKKFIFSFNFWCTNCYSLNGTNGVEFFPRNMNAQSIRKLLVSPKHEIVRNLLHSICSRLIWNSSRNSMQTMANAIHKLYFYWNVFCFASHSTDRNFFSEIVHLCREQWLIFFNAYFNKKAMISIKIHCMLWFYCRNIQ